MCFFLCGDFFLIVIKQLTPSWPLTFVTLLLCLTKIPQQLWCHFWQEFKCTKQGFWFPSVQNLEGTTTYATKFRAIFSSIFIRQIVRKQKCFKLITFTNTVQILYIISPLKKWRYTKQIKLSSSQRTSLQFFYFLCLLSKV